MKNLLLIIPLLFLAACSAETESTRDGEEKWESTQSTDGCELAPVDLVSSTSIVILGTCQDGGSPHINCEKACCEELQGKLNPDRLVVSLGAIDPENELKYIFEASPDFPAQLLRLRDHCPFESSQSPDGVFLTHAHIGHYTGLMFLGKESMDADEVPVYAMPRMKTFLKTNGPWDLLVHRENMLLQALQDKQAVELSSNLTVTPFLVPHRDEYSETVGYTIEGPDKSALFIPDIDKWDKWETPLKDALSEVDYAFIDATFYDEKELPGRDMSEIPHPFVVETMERLKDLPDSEKSKIIFIHLNHTNKLLDPKSEEYRTVINKGFKVAQLGDVFEL